MNVELSHLDPLARRSDLLHLDLVRQHVHPLARILAFFRYSIDDVVDRPEVKRKVARAYKAAKTIHRSIDARRAGRPMRCGMYR